MCYDATSAAMVEVLFASGIPESLPGNRFENRLDPFSHGGGSLFASFVFTEFCTAYLSGHSQRPSVRPFA